MREASNRPNQRATGLHEALSRGRAWARRLRGYDQAPEFQPKVRFNRL
jgi:hypothetical protein